MIEPTDILFLGLGKSAPLWYRGALFAQTIGADWAGVSGRPPGLIVETGIVRGATKLPLYGDYRVVVIQYAHGREWMSLIKRLRSEGITVLFEVDDYLHAVRKQAHHDYASHFSKEVLAEYELCMRVCDGIICSTEYLARRYTKFNRHIYVVPNGIDLDRYELTIPERDTVNVGWAGATGHLAALLPWVNELLTVMRERQHVRFVSIGEPGVAAQVGEMLGRHRAFGIPFAPLECYPAAMCHMDIVLAPAVDNGWYRAKSDLRWLEASALGLPTIASPVTYGEIEDGVTGFLAREPWEVAEILRTLIDDTELRARVGAAARDYVIRERSIDQAAARWFEACAAAAGHYESVSQLRRT